MPCSKLSAKYAILHKFGAAIWAPSSHTSSVPLHMEKLIYAIGTKSPIDFGNYVFDLTMKHGDTFVVKLPVAFPCLLTELILAQHPDILMAGEREAPKSKPLNFDYRIFVGTHVNDIEIPYARDSDHPGSVSGSAKEQPEGVNVENPEAEKGDEEGSTEEEEEDSNAEEGSTAEKEGSDEEEDTATTSDDE